MKKKRPIIAITHSDFQSKLVIGMTKLAIWLAGGKSISVTEKYALANDCYDGLLLYGGVDIHPKHYGKKEKIGYRYDEKRDELEFKLLLEAEKKGIPVLGICRGCQIMNVHRGGTLHQDITKLFEYTKYPSSVLGYVFFRKWIQLDKKSKLYGLLQKDKIQVNSIHKQSIEQLGADLSISAVEENQIVQGIEDKTKPFYIGVQFHPEFLVYRKLFLALFKSFITRCK